MLVDARLVPNNKTIETDICILGAGAAGITLATELAGQPFRVSVLEGGGLELDPSGQSLYEGENSGVPYYPLEAARLRFLGGSTNHWGGWCWPFSANDFKVREWVPYSGWPFDKTHLDPYYQRAQVVCQLGPYDYNPNSWQDHDSRPLPFQTGRVQTQIIQINPLRFKDAYRPKLQSADNITVYLNANALEIETTANAKTVTKVPVGCLSGNRFFVKAKLFVLATGGIENARLLLLSNKVQRAGLGNQHDLVGRFFMDHVHIFSGRILLLRPELYTDFYRGGVDPKTQTKFRAALTLSDKVQQQEQLVSYSCNPLTVYDRELYDSVGLASLRKLYQSAKNAELSTEFWKHLVNVVTDVDALGRAAYRTIVQRKPLITSQVYDMAHHIAQAPNPDSRVTLSRKRDALGSNRVRLHWRISAMEKHTIRRAQEIIGQEIGRAGLGRVQIGEDGDWHLWTPEQGAHTWKGPEGSFHHCGTTRMHVDPKEGVVDANCRVHSVSNLFVAGSSVFPTIGYANPTLTIVALTIRLADHLKKSMRI
jgi:choline dehydrogenase-like flavoprotein